MLTEIFHRMGISLAFLPLDLREEAIQIAEVRHVSLYAGHISSDLLDGPNFHREVSVLSARLGTCGKCFLQ
jgi:hypothetical protein